MLNLLACMFENDIKLAKFASLHVRNVVKLTKFASLHISKRCKNFANYLKNLLAYKMIYAMMFQKLEIIQ